MTRKWREIPRNAVRLPPYHPLLCLYDEPGKRVSKCRGCQFPIPKATPRLVAHILIPGGRVFPNGGHAATARFFFHPECFGDARNSLADRRCYDCGEEILGAGHYLGGGGPVRLCDGCITTLRYRKCDICSCYFPTPKVSKILDTGHPHRLRDVVDLVDVFACDRCADNDGIETVKSKLRQTRADNKFEIMYLSVLERIKDKGIFG